MKKILVFSLLSVFAINQVSLAYDSRGEINNSQLMEKLVLSKISAQISSMSESEKSKLITDVNGSLDGIDQELSKISEEEFAMLKAVAINKTESNKANIDTLSFEFTNTLSANEKNILSQNISEEDMVLSSSQDEAIAKSFSTVITSNLNENKMKIKEMTVGNLKVQVKELKEKMKNISTLPSWVIALCVTLIAIGTLTAILGFVLGVMVTVVVQTTGLGIFFGGLGLTATGIGSLAMARR